MSFSNFELNTVDGFQGREVDVVVVSSVRANGANSSIGFLNDARRLNVAVTRAKYGLFVVGALASFRDSKVWTSFVDYVKARGVVREVRDANEKLL